MNIYIELLMVCFLVVFIVDIAGIAESIKSFLSKKLKAPVKRLKPFDCSFCLSWWCCLAWIVIRGHFSLPLICYCAAMAIFSLPLGELIKLMNSLLLSVINKIFNKIER